MKGETPGHCVNLSHSLIHCVVCMMGLEVERRMGGGWFTLDRFHLKLHIVHTQAEWGSDDQVQYGIMYVYYNTIITKVAPCRFGYLDMCPLRPSRDHGTVLEENRRFK